MSRYETLTGFEGRGDSLTHTLVFLPCPYAFWILLCPFVGTDKCKEYCEKFKPKKETQQKGEGETNIYPHSHNDV